MIALRPAPQQESEWLGAWEARLREMYVRFSPSAEWVDRQIANRVNVPGATDCELFELVEGEKIVGRLAMLVVEGRAILRDVFVVPEQRGRGFGRQALDAALAWAAQRDVPLALTADAGDPVHQALFAAIPPRSLNMVKVLSDSDNSAPGRPMSEVDYARWQDLMVHSYAQQIVDAGLLPLDKALERSRSQFQQYLPDGRHTPGQAFWCIEAEPGGGMAASLWLGHGYLPGMTWVLGVDVDETLRGKGFGREAMLLAERAALDAGDVHIGLNVFAYNTPAVKLYEKLGYLVYHQYRSQ